MDDARVQSYLEKLTKQIRGDGDMPPQQLTTKQLDDVLYLVRAGQLSPKDYNFYLANSSKRSDASYKLSPTDVESYNSMNPKTPEEGVKTAEEYLSSGRTIPDHLIGQLNKFYEAGKLSEEDRRRYITQESPAAKEKAKKPASAAEEPKTPARHDAPPADGEGGGRKEEEPQPGASEPYVQVGLGPVLKNLHLKAAAEVSKATGDRIRITNTAYDDQTGVFNTAPGLYIVRASSTRPLDAFGNWFRSKTARKALVMYLSSFLGPELAERFKNASLYQPSTTTKDGNIIQRRAGVFGRLKNWATGKAYDLSAAGSKGAVKDVTNKVISYWMKYKLVNGSVSESWIKFAMPGKPLVISESADVHPSEADGWTKLTPERVMESQKHVVKTESTASTPSERFVESALQDDEIGAQDALMKLLEAKLAKRLSEVK